MRPSETMEKTEAVNWIIKKIYSYNDYIEISADEIDKVEGYYKNSFKKFSSFDEFLNFNNDVKSIVDRFSSGKFELSKQFACQKGLQRGILTECVYMQCLAKILDLKDLYPLRDADCLGCVPDIFKKYITNERLHDSSLAARYLYCNKNDDSLMIIQYGDPNSCDAQAVIYANNVVIEIKDMPATILEYDLRYTEDGWLNYPKQNNIYNKYIDRFNKERSVFERDGNFKIFTDNEDNDKIIPFFKGYFDVQNVDLLVTSDKHRERHKHKTLSSGDRLIAIKVEDICRPLDDGSLLIDVSGSEIRTLGRNHLKPFTPEYLNHILDKLGARVKDGICYMPADKCLEKKGRGRTDVTKVEFGHYFFVSVGGNNQVRKSDGYWIFPENKIQQTECHISTHVSIEKSKDEICSLLKYDSLL